MKKESDPHRPTMRRGKCPRWPEDWIYKDYCEKCGRCERGGRESVRVVWNKPDRKDPIRPHPN